MSGKLKFELEQQKVELEEWEYDEELSIVLLYQRRGRVGENREKRIERGGGGRIRIRISNTFIFNKNIKHFYFQINSTHFYCIFPVMIVSVMIIITIRIKILFDSNEKSRSHLECFQSLAQSSNSV